MLIKEVSKLMETRNKMPGELFPSSAKSLKTIAALFWAQGISSLLVEPATRAFVNMMLVNKAPASASHPFMI
jgi:hypothetical protein